MSAEFSSIWLALREPADAAARSADLVNAVRELLKQELLEREVRQPVGPPLVIRDLGCGTGSLGRWLAPQLPNPQHWILQDRDPALLTHVGTSLPGDVSVETRQGDVTALTGEDLAGTSLITCSALLDLLTTDEVEALAAACAVHGTPALFTLSVTGEVAFDTADPLDQEIAGAFNRHQRRIAGGRQLLGPDAAEVAATAFGKQGATVTVRPSPWRLEADSPLATEWLRGWLAAAREQCPDLRIDDYLARRTAHRSGVAVGHVDLLANFRLNFSGAPRRTGP